MLAVWIFVAAVLTSTGPATVTSDQYATEDACEAGRSQWLRAQTDVEIVELGQCQRVGAEVVKRRGK